MKRFLNLIAITLAVVVSSSCEFDDTDIWNKLNDHEERISDLEELCKQMNTNISALQAVVNALQKNDYITNVAPIRKDGEEIGYTITFAYGDTITIYHGQNGKDGENGTNGKDGYTPKIGVMKDTDGIYYWTVDGEWLLDGKGNKIQANGINGVDGTNGTNGSNGTNGTDGITPRLKIENDYWYVSYDNGVTWEQLGKATGEDGANGDTIFSSVTQDDEYVYFNMSDGTMITLPKNDKENIQFEDLQVKAICCKNWDTNNDGELSYAEAAAVTDIGNVFYANKNIVAFTELKYFTSLTKIPASEFYTCTSLWKISLPVTIEQIGYDAFRGCTSLTNVNIPNHNLTSIGEGVFTDATHVNLYISDLSAWCKTNYQYSVLSNVQKMYFNGQELSDLTIPSDVEVIGKGAFKNAKFITNITIPDSVTSIEEGAFNGCENVVDVTIGRGILTIDNKAFACKNLKNIYCKAVTPPAIYYCVEYSYVEGYAIPTGTKIYVPRSSYDLYTQYSYSDHWNGVKQHNWGVYNNYIEPYDFE